MCQDLSFALRQLIRQPGLSSAAAGTLGIGLAACIAVFTLVNAVVLRPLPYPDSDRVMALGRTATVGIGSGDHRDVRFLREHVRTCGPIAASVNGSGLNASLQGRAAHLDDRLISRGYFEALGVQPRWGRTFSVDEDADVPPPVVILNERFARRQGLDPAQVVGREIALAGVTNTIVGVVAARDTLATDPDVFRPLGQDPRGGGINLDIVCRLAPGATPAALAGELTSLTEPARAERLIGERSRRAYAAISRHEREFGLVRSPLLTLMMAVGLVLLVAAANTTSLLLVRAAGRRREIAVRTALGAAPARIARTLLLEGLLLAALAGTLGLAAAPLLIRVLLAVAPAHYRQLAEFTLDATVFATAFVVSAIVGLTMSVPPQLEVLRVNLRDTLQEEGQRATAGRRTLWLRQAFVGAETAVCAVLLVGALLLLRTFINLVSVPTGFDATNVITARMPVQGPQYADGQHLIRFFEDGLSRLAQLPGIEGAAVAASLPGERALNLPARLPDADDPQNIVVVNWRYVTPNYFDLLKIRHVAGRPVTGGDRQGAPAVALVNVAFAQELFGGVDQAIGRRIVIHPMTKDINDPVREVVGVVADTVGWSIGDVARPLMFVPLAQVDGGLLRSVHAFFSPRWVIRTDRNLDGARRALESVVRDLDPNQPFIDVRTVESMMRNSIATERFYMAVLLAFAIFAVVLAAVGIYASYSYTVASRTQEIGIRLALGAAPRRILARIVGQSLLQGAVATSIGLAVAAAATRALQTILFGVTATDPVTYAIVAMTLLTTVFAATVVPALRAARVDPLVAMRR